MARLMDVTVPLSSDVPTFPGDPRFQMEFVHRIEDGKPYNVAQFNMGAHSGTHVDAPFHFLPQGATVDQLPLEILMGKARVIALSCREAVRREDLEEHDLTDELRVLLKTHNSGQLRHSVFQGDFIYVTPEAAAYLVQVGIKLLGFDALSVEKFGSKDFKTHHTLLEAGVVIVEGLDLTDVEPGEYDMACLPLRLVGADGSPARVVLRHRL